MTDQEIYRKIGEQVADPFFADTVYLSVLVLRKSFSSYPEEQIKSLLKTISLEEVKYLYHRLPMESKDTLPIPYENLVLSPAMKKTITELLHNLEL